MTRADVQAQLVTFFRKHLGNDFQNRLAQAHFLEGMSPGEMAALTGSKPHEIRMIKAGVVDTLRHLEPEEHKQLIQMMDALQGAKGAKEPRKHPVETLRWALSGPPGPHLDRTQLAEIASAEAAAVNVQARFEEALAHLESCKPCAEAYYELLEMMVDAVAGMGQVTRSVSPVDVYVALLRPALAQQTPPGMTASALAQRIALALPYYFTDAPDDTASVGDDVLAKVLTQALGEQEAPPGLPAALAAGLRQRLSVLALYLQGMADRAWGRALNVVAEGSADWYSVRLEAVQQDVNGASEPAVSKKSGGQWILLQESLHLQPPLTLEARAARLSPLACQIVVRISQPQAVKVTSRPVQVQHKNGELQVETDDAGYARLGPLPVASVAGMTLRVAL